MKIIPRRTLIAEEDGTQSDPQNTASSVVSALKVLLIRVKTVINTLTIQTSLKSFLLGSLGSAVILLYKRFRGSSSRPSVSSLSLPAFLSSFSLLTRLTLCLMRRIRGKDEASHGAVAGGIFLLDLRSVYFLLEVLLPECLCCSTETLTSLSTCSGNLTRSVCRYLFHLN